MPFETFVDSRGNEHEIYMQEKTASCGIASVCTLMHLMGGLNHVEESHLRRLSQELDSGYRPHPRDIGPVQFTFIADLVRKNKLHKKDGKKLLSPRSHGAHPDAVAKLLAKYQLYSSKRAISDLKANQNHLDALRGKVLLLAVKGQSDINHAIIVRDVWDDGTCIVYDPTKGLIETKDIAEQYPNVVGLVYVNYQNNAYISDLEAGPRPLTEDDVIIGDDESPSKQSSFNKMR